MGYTHYWHQKRNFTTAEWLAITADTRAVLANAAKDGIDLLYERDSNKPPLIDSETIRFNGNGDEGHETFVLERKRRAKRDYEDAAEYKRDGSFNFCKTARKPYDAVVTAVLLIAAHVAPNAIKLSSDGENTDWARGLAMAQAAGGESITIPPELHRGGDQP